MLKNYTSGVPASKSVSHIEECLASHGAKSVVKQYNDGHLVAVSFFMQIGDRLTPFRLPARINKVESVLHASVKRPREGTLTKLTEQAERTAWKIISDWVDAQMALVELQQAEISEIFMPYMWNERLQQSLYQRLQKMDFNLLEGPKK